MKPIVVIILICFRSLYSFAQTYFPDSVSKLAISKLNFIVGEWKGTGTKPVKGKIEEFLQTEKVQYKLDSTILVIEGVGKLKDEIFHNALGIISYDKTKNEYIFQTYLSTGKGGTFKGEFKENNFVWHGGETTRYTIFLNKDGQWVEIGETTNDGGNTWFKFLEMTLDKIKK